MGFRMVGKIARRNHKQPIISRRMRNKIALTISILVVIAIAYWAASKPDGPPDTFIQLPGFTSHEGGVNLG